MQASSEFTLLWRNSSRLERWKIAVATFFGAGFVPKIPGTVGSFLALLAGFGIIAVSVGGSVVLSFAVALLTAWLLGFWSVPLLESHLDSDPACVVIDEVIGMWTVMLLIEIFLPSPMFSWQFIVLEVSGFALFRLFDIAKPYPISRLNAQRGAFFVLIDDAVAGLFASGGVFFLWLIWQLFGK